MTNPTPAHTFKHELVVRIDDINFGNHLCHSKFINIIHNTRALFLKKYGLSEIDCFGCGLVMLSLNIDYISQCYFDDLLEVTININKLQQSKLLLDYNVYNKATQKLAAKATTLMGFLDLNKMKLKKAPLEFCNLFAIN